jgi:hypothetical protein
MTCPNKKSKEYLVLRDTYSEPLVYKLFIANNNELPTLERAKDILTKNPKIDKEFNLCGTVYSDQIKVDLIEGIQGMFLRNLIADGFDVLFSKRLSTEALLNLYNKVILNTAQNLQKQPGREKLATDVWNDINFGASIFKELKTSLEQYNIIVDDLDKINEKEDEFNTNSRSLDIRNGLEHDTKSGYGRSTKLLLASIADYVYENNQIVTNKNNLGLVKNANLASFNNKLAKLLANSPADTNSMLEILRKAGLKDARFAKLYEFLGNTSDYSANNFNIKQLRKQFVKDMCKNIYDMDVVTITNDGEILVHNTNTDTIRKHILTNWKANFQLSLQNNNILTLTDLQEQLRAAGNDVKKVAELLGVNPKDKSLLAPDSQKKKDFNAAYLNLANLLLSASSVVQTYAESDNLNIMNLYDTNQRIHGTFYAMSDLASEDPEETTDFQVFSGQGKVLNTLNLNTYQTYLKNQINFYVNQIIEENPDNNTEQNKPLIKERLYKKLPFLFHNNTANSLWLDKILNGNEIKIGLINSLKNQQEDGDDLASLAEADLYTTIFALVLNNKFPALKHADRNQYYYYEIGDGKYDPFNIDESINGNWDEWQATFKDKLRGYFKDELNRILLVKNNVNNIRIVDNVIKQGESFAILEEVIPKDGMLYQSIFNAATTIYSSFNGISNKETNITVADELLLNKKYETLSNKLNDALDTWTNKYFEKAVNEVKSLSLTNSYKTTFKSGRKEMLGISNKMFDKFNSYLNPYNNKNINEVKEEIVKIIAAKWFLSSVEQSKIFFGDPMFYGVKSENNKRIFDLSKRLNMQSSSKENCVVDKETNNEINNLNDSDDARFLSADGTLKNYSKAVVKKANGYFTEIVVNDVKFQGRIYDDLVKLLGENHPTTIAYSKGVNSADGFSWTNMFFAREFAYRSGQVNFEGLNRTFKNELKIYNEGFENAVKSIEIPLQYNVTPGVRMMDEKGNVMYNITEYIENGELKQVKQEILQTEEGAKKEVERYMYEYHSPFVITKPQYVGPQYMVDPNLWQQQDINNPNSDILSEQERLFIIALRKTSYMPLIPSVVEGSTLEKLNRWMIENGVDVIHFESAAKVGAKQHRDVYNSETKEVNLNELDETNELGILDFNYLGKQVEIAPKPKLQNTVSSQERSNKHANGFDAGKPVSEEFIKDFKDYHEKQTELTLLILKKLKEELLKIDENLLQPTDLEREYAASDNSNNPDVYQMTSRNGIEFIRVVRDEAITRGNAQNIIDAIEDWANTDGTLKWLETLPNYSKIQSILSSMINNRTLGEKRPGTAQPQASSLGFESNALNLGENGWRADDTLKFYTYEYDADGNVIKVNPAEIMMSLPYEWIPGLLAQYENEGFTYNIYQLVERVNADLAEGKVFEDLLIKGLRIPNQQQSSNDCFKIKKFLMPGLEQAIVIPIEMVTKTGGDFDIDKMNLYFPNYKFNPETRKLEYLRKRTDNNEIQILQNEILELENRLFLNAKRFDSLVAPVDDSVLKELANAIVKSAESYTNQFELNTFIKQLRDFVGGKDGLGIVATWITFHNMTQYLGTTLNNSDGELILDKTIFPNGNSNLQLGHIKNVNNEKIEDSLSALLTAMVDVVKDAYATDLNLIKQTLNATCYLVCRGVPLKDITNFLTKPTLVQYLKDVRQNSSEIYKYTKEYDEFENSEGLQLTSAELKAKYYRDPFVEEWLRINDQADKMTTLKDYLKVATERLKTPDQASDALKLRNRVLAEGIVTEKELLKFENDTYLKGFFEVRKDIRDLFRPLYATKTNKIFYEQYNKVIGALLKSERKSEKAKISERIEQGLVNYLIQTRNSEFNDVFEKLFIGKNSIGKRLTKLKFSPVGKKSPLIQELVTLANNDVVNINGKDYTIDNIRLFNGKMNSFELNRMIAYFNELALIAPDLAKDIILVNILQSGLSNSYLQLAKILPYEQQKSIFDTLGTLDTKSLTGEDLTKFFVFYLLSNHKLIPTVDKRNKKSYTTGAGKTKNFPIVKVYEDKKKIIKKFDNNEVVNALGSINFASVELMGKDWRNKYKELVEFIDTVRLDVDNSKNKEKDLLDVTPKTTTKTLSQQIADLRAEEQAELTKVIPNIKEYLDSGTYGEKQGKMPDNLYALYKPIYDMYDEFIKSISTQPSTGVKKTIKEFKVGEQVQDGSYNIWKIISQEEYEKESKVGMKAGVKARFITNVNPNEARKADVLNPDSTTYIKPNSVNTLGENTLVQSTSEESKTENKVYTKIGNLEIEDNNQNNC